jgi:hypothetical protein
MGSPHPQVSGNFSANSTPVTIRVFQRQQLISYWNQRVELNKARWSPEMRATFERNLQVIDQAVSQSLNELDRNPMMRSLSRCSMNR